MTFLAYDIEPRCLLVDVDNSMKTTACFSLGRTNTR